MSFLKDKSDPRYINQYQALQTIDAIVYQGIQNKFDTDQVKITWTDTQQWYKMVRQRLIDQDRQQKFPAIAVARTNQKINWQHPNIPVTTGEKYILQRKQIQGPYKRQNGRYTYEPSVWQITQTDPPIFIIRTYSVSIVTNMQQDYNAVIQDMLSIFQGGRTYLQKQQDVSQRTRRLFNRYGVHIHITGQNSQTINNTGTGNRLFQKEFELTTQTYLYRNIQKVRTKTRLSVNFVQGV